MKLWTEDDQTRAQQMRADGASFDSIAKALGFAKSTVIHNLKKPDPNYSQSKPTASSASNVLRRWTVNDSQMLEKLLAQGMPRKQIASTMCWSYKTIKERIRARARPTQTPPTRDWWTDAHTQRAVAMRKAGLMCKDVALAMGFSVETVFRHTAPYKLPRVSAKRAAKTRKSEVSAAAVITLTPPRTITNATTRERLTGGTWIPARPGAMDYARVPSRGF